MLEGKKANWSVTIRRTCVNLKILDCRDHVDLVNETIVIQE